MSYFPRVTAITATAAGLAVLLCFTGISVQAQSVSFCNGELGQTNWACDALYSIPAEVGCSLPYVAAAYGRCIISISLCISMVLCFEIYMACKSQREIMIAGIPLPGTPNTIDSDGWPNHLGSFISIFGV